MSTTVSFPGLGIGEFSFDRVAFEIFGKPVYWYGIIIMLGIVAAFIHAKLRCKPEGIKTDDIIDAGIFTVLFGVLGARLYYVVTTLDTEKYETIVDVFAIWEGGLAIYGGVICGCTALVLTAVHKKINPLKIMDAVGPGVMLAQAIGRWGNFMNGEAFGSQTTNFLRMGIYNYNSIYTFRTYEMVYVHPTFLYESLWNLVGFIGINIFYKHKKYDGQIFLMIFGWYGLGRMWIEGLRMDSLFLFGSSIRVSQALAIILFVTCAALLIYFAIKKPDRPFYRMEEVKTDNDKKDAK